MKNYEKKLLLFLSFLFIYGCSSSSDENSTEINVPGANVTDIDGNVFVEDIDKSVIKAGDLLEVEITDADEYDLFAKLIQIKSA